jgi:hypothetical protein
MPVNVLKPALESAFKGVLDAEGNPAFVKRNFDGSVILPLELADGTKRMIEAITNGVVAAWVTWQAAQGIAGVTVGVGAVPGPAALP